MTIFWYWKNLIKSGVYVKELFREKYISMYILYILIILIHIQKKVLNVCEDNPWLFWASRDTREVAKSCRLISTTSPCEGRRHCPWLGTEYSASIQYLIPVEMWFIPGGAEEDKVPDQIDTVETISAGVIASVAEQPRSSHGTGTHRGRNVLCIVCTMLCIEMVLITCF